MWQFVKIILIFSDFKLEQQSNKTTLEGLSQLWEWHRWSKLKIRSQWSDNYSYNDEKNVTVFFGVRNLKRFWFTSLLKFTPRNFNFLNLNLEFKLLKVKFKI